MDADDKKKEFEKKLIDCRYGKDCHTVVRIFNFSLNLLHTCSGYCFLQKVKISYASERHWNPVKKVYFYSEVYYILYMYILIISINLKAKE